MIRAIIVSMALTGAPVVYLIQADRYHAVMSALLIFSIASAIFLARSIYRRAQRQTIDILSQPASGETLDLILAEVERRAGRQDTPTAK